jgi:hypothetical protein
VDKNRNAKNTQVHELAGTQLETDKENPVKLPFLSRFFSSFSSQSEKDSPGSSGVAKEMAVGGHNNTQQYQPGEWSFVTVGEKYIYSEGSGTIALVIVLKDKSDAEYEAFTIQIIEPYAGSFSKKISTVTLRRDVKFTWVGKMKFTKIYPFIKNYQDLNYTDEQIQLINSLTFALAILQISPYRSISYIDKIMDKQHSVMSEVKEKYKKPEEYKKEFDVLLEKMSSQYTHRNYPFVSNLLHWLPNHKERFSDPGKALAFLITLQRIMEKQPKNTPTRLESE